MLLDQEIIKKIYYYINIKLVYFQEIIIFLSLYFLIMIIQFITGVAPITLDSLTSGFNIGTDITQDIDFNDIMGFTRDELVEILNNQEISAGEQEKILPIMKEKLDLCKGENRLEILRQTVQGEPIVNNIVKNLTPQQNLLKHI